MTDLYEVPSGYGPLCTRNATPSPLALSITILKIRVGIPTWFGPSVAGGNTSKIGPENT